MDRFKLSLVALLAFRLSAQQPTVSTAPVVIQSAGTPVGAAAVINFSTNTAVSMSGAVATVTGPLAAAPASALALGSNGSGQLIAWMDSTWAGTPSISSCGSGTSQLAAGSTDRRGMITEGATATGCTLTFSVNTHTTATCWVSSGTGLLFTYATTAGSGGGFTVGNSGMFSLTGGNLSVGPAVSGNPVLYYICEP